MKKEKAKILKSIKRGIKEMTLIEAGKKHGQPTDEMIAELIKERDGRPNTQTR